MVVTIASILTWTRYFYTRKLFHENPGMLEHAISVNPALNEKVSIWKGDITTIAADAIVNAANTSLLGGGGVDGAIHKAAGKGLLEECSKLNGCTVGDAKVSKGYDLPAKFVIHTVGPMDRNPEHLSSCYENSFKMMLQYSLMSIAFPCISTGVYGYDPWDAAHVALLETRKFLQRHYENVDRVVFCVYSDEDLHIYEQLMQRYFPIVETEDYSCTVNDFKVYAESLTENPALVHRLTSQPTWKKISFSELTSKV